MSWFTTAPEIAFVPVSTKPIDEKVVNLEKTLEGVDAEILPRIEKKILEIKEHLTSDPAGWEFLLESQGVRGIRKYVDERPIAVIRSEIVMPFHILDIFEFFNNTTNACSLDPAINTIEVFKRISPHNWISRVMLHGVSTKYLCNVCVMIVNTILFIAWSHILANNKQQWPVLSPREFINFFHWRLMEDGSILYLDFSVRMDDAFPEVEDPVRGWDNVNGYLFRPTADGKGTDVHMIFDVRIEFAVFA